MDVVGKSLCTGDFDGLQAVGKNGSEGHCQVVWRILRKAMLVSLGSHLSGIASPKIESI